MIGLQFEFLTGRYHATPWNRQVNEGAVEWPPSPWRLLRALIATWHLKGHDLADVEVLDSLVESLAADVPRYRLPDAVQMHTRHYMPLYQPFNSKGKKNTTKVFDAFVHMGHDQSMEMVWTNTDLSDGQRRVLDVLATRMSYLGRAESWVSASLMGEVAASAVEPNTVPIQAERATEDGVLADTLAPVDPANYASWRKEQVERHQQRILADKRSEGYKEKITASNQRKINRAVPEQFVDAVRIDTGTLKKFGWNRPPGSRWIKYVRPELDHSRGVSRMPPSRQEDHPTVARFRVAGKVVPRMTKAVVVGDSFRKGLMSKSDGAPVFSGRSDAGELLEGHRHVHIIPEALERHGRITHVTLFAPMGFDERAQSAIERLDKIWSNGTVSFDLQTLLLGLGQPDDFAGLRPRAGHCLALATAKTWRSRTPFVPTRHRKTRNDGTPKLDDNDLPIGGPEHDLRRLLDEAGLPEPTAVEPMKSAELGGKQTSWLDFRTQRPSGKGRRSTYRGFGFEVEFPEPVSGPICVGYGAHYGLGRFEPVVAGENG